jgi:hypothetical protein
MFGKKNKSADKTGLLLNPEAKKMSDFQKHVMKKVAHQSNLARYLLFKDYEEKR